MKMILASSSKQRATLLRNAGFVFDVAPAAVDESRRSDEPAGEYVQRLAEMKARAIFEFTTRALRPGEIHTGKSFEESMRQLAEAKARAAQISSALEYAVAIGADTVITVDGLVLGKPENAAGAREMLGRLSGRTHKVVTGLAVLVWPADRIRVELERTRVKFAPLTDAEIEDYIASGEPFDKAGAYAIQGRGGRFVERVEGCYFNVVGLPLARLYRLLREVGWKE
jgi:septum formation protein